MVLVYPALRGGLLVHGVGGSSEFVPLPLSLAFCRKGCFLTGAEPLEAEFSCCLEKKI